MSNVSPTENGFISVVHVQPIPGQAEIGGEIAGAYVVTLALAFSEQHFKERVFSEFDSDGFVVVGWGEISQFDLAENDWHSDTTRTLHELLSAEHPVQYSQFDAYDRDGLDA